MSKQDKEIKLLVSGQEAKQKMEDQLEKGKLICAIEPTMDLMMQDKQQKMDKWVSYTKNLLEKIFNDSGPAKEFEKSGTKYWMPVMQAGPTHIGYQNKTVNEIMRGHLTCLESYIEQCALYSEVENVSIKNKSQGVAGDIDWQLIHPAIGLSSRKKFEDGHLADSVESAFKEINVRVKAHVKLKTGKEIDGAPLMTQAFSPNNPIIFLGDQATESGRNMQQGYMQIFAGSMTGIRNPKAHENLIIEKSRAIHFLFLASLLMFKLDEVIAP